MAGQKPKDKEPATGARPEWKTRQQRKRVFGIIKTFIGVIFLGVLVGFGVVYRQQIMDFVTALLEKKEPTRVVSPTPPVAPATTSTKAPEVVPPPVPVPDTPAAVQPVAKPTVTPEVVPTGEEAAATKLIDGGIGSLEQFKFDDAEQAFNQAAALKCGAKLRSEAKTWANKTKNFKTALKHIKIADYAQGDNACSVHMVDGTELVGLKLSENDQQIVFQRINRDNPAADGKSSGPLPRVEIKDMKSIPMEKRTEQFLQLLGALESNVGDIACSTDYYDLVYLSRRLSLGKQCIQYLNRAYDGGPSRKPDPYLGDSFRKEVVRRYIERASLMVAAGRTETSVKMVLNDLKKTLPDFSYAAEEIEAFQMKVRSTVKEGFKSTIKEVKVVAAAQPKVQGPSKLAPAVSARQMTNSITEGDQVEYVVENSGVKGSGAAGPIVDQANAKYEEGMKTYRQFRQGTNGSNNQVLRAAMKMLEEAVDLYDKALAKDPNNMSIQNRQTEANMIVYACKKYQTL